MGQIVHKFNVFIKSFYFRPFVFADNANLDSSNNIGSGKKCGKVLKGHFYRFSSKITIKYWSLGSFFCRSGSFIALLNLNSSTLFLVMMSIDRFLALTRPMQSYHFRTRKMVNYLSKMCQNLLSFCSGIFVLSSLLGSEFFNKFCCSSLP